MDSEEKAPLLGVQNKAAPNNRKHSQCPSDQCVISNDDYIETFQADWTTSDYDIELAGKVPPLPENKDRHLFVSYSSEDYDDVMAIVNQLEQRFHVSCIISARDFQSGKDIIANIKESINRSMKNVFMLTPNFVQSGFCKFERDVAFMTSIETGINNVIPVMLHECDVPTSLSTVTYIDAMLPGIDVPAKIIEALIQSELADGTLSLEDHILSKKYENGYCVPFKSQPVKRCLGILPSVYTFELKPEDISSLRRAKIKVNMHDMLFHPGTCGLSFQLPEEQLELMFQRLNKSSLVARYNLTRSSCKLCLVFSSCFFIVLSSAGFAPTISVLHNKGLNYSMLIACIFYFVVVVNAVTFICPILSCVMSARCNNHKRELSLQMHVWKAVSGQCIQYNCIPVVERSRQTPPTLNIMRYNFHGCQTYLAGLIRSRGIPSEYESPEVNAEAVIKSSISHLINHLTPSLEELPIAPYNRHCVLKSKMCLCQMIEAGLPLVNGPDSIV